MASARPGSKDPSMSFTSVVFDDAGEWWKRGMLIPHEALRWEFIYMSQALSAEHFNGEKWKAKKFFQFWKFFYEAVHEHHGVEEQLYFPHLATKKALPEKITSDHRTLMKMMDDVSAMESAFTNDENPAAADQLRVSFTELQKLMCEHLAEEEQTIAPLVRDHFTEAEDREFVSSVLVPHIIQTYGMGATSRSFGRIEHAMKKWAGDEFAAQWLEQNMPPPLRVLMDLTWRSTYNDDILGLLRAMELKEEPVDDSVIGQAGAAAAAAGDAVAPLASAAAESIAPLASAAGEAASAAGEAVGPAAAAASEAASAGAAAVSDAVSAAGEAVGPAVAGLMGSLSSLVSGGAEAAQ